MVKSQIGGARLTGLIGFALTTAFVPRAARAADVQLLCGFDTSFGDGPESTYPRRNESRVLIDLTLAKVRYTSPGSGDMLGPFDASISDTSVRWTVGRADSMQMNYSIDRASATYTARLTVQGTAQPGGNRGSCLPKVPF
jgi:hypothetical protein